MENLQYRILQFDLPQFLMNVENYETDIPINVGIEFQFAYNDERHIIKSSVIVAMSQNEKQFLKMQIDTYIEIKDTSVADMITENGLHIPKMVQCQFASFGYGALRGVMYDKTINTPLNTAILPPIEISKIITGDLVIPTK